MGAPLDPVQKRAQARIDDLEDTNRLERPKLEAARRDLATYRMQAHPDPRTVAEAQRAINKRDRDITDRENEIRNLKLRHGLR